METTTQESRAPEGSAPAPDLAAEYRSAMANFRAAAVALQVAAALLLKADRAFDPGNTREPDLMDRGDWQNASTALCAFADMAPGYREIFELAALSPMRRVLHHAVRRVRAELTDRFRRLVGRA